MREAQMANDMDDDTELEMRAAPKRRGGVITDATKAGLKAALGDMTPRQLGAQKAAQGLDWVHRWGWSCGAVLSTLAGTGRNSGLGARLVKNGWLRREPIKIVSSYTAVPTDLLTITDAGVIELIALRGELAPSKADAVNKRIDRKNVIHDLKVQRLTLQFMGRLPDEEIPSEFFEEYGLVTDFLTAHQHGEASLERKIPDAVWVTESGHTLAIELELTPKYKRELDQFITGHISLQRREVGGMDGLVTFFSSSAAADRYRAAMTPGSQITSWLRDSQKREWYTTSNTPKVVVDDTFRFQDFLI